MSAANYYRLKMIDEGGGFSYSKVLIIKFDNNSDFSVFPNPARDVLNVQMQLPAGTIVLQIMDAIGRQLRTMPLQSTG